MSAVNDKSLAFAIQIVLASKRLREVDEYIMSKQLLRSGTAIGALVREAEQAESRADFVHKMSVALKEANETAYWLDLLHATSYLSREAFLVARQDCRELLRLLTSIIKSTRATS